MLLALALFVVIASIRYIATSRKTQVAMPTTEETSISAEAYIVRDESIFENPGEGIFNQDVANGERIPKGTKVGTLILGEIDSSLNGELEEINTRIKTIEDAQSIVNIYSSDDSRISSAIGERTSELIKSVLKNDISSAVSHETEITLLIQRRMGVLESSATAGQLEELKARKASIEAQIGNVKKPIYAMQSGVFYVNTDSLENIISTKNILNVSAEDISSFAQMCEESKNSKGLFKIVNNHVWYALMLISKEEAEDIKEGETTLYLDDEKMSANIVKITNEHEGKVGLVIECGQDSENVMEKRVLNARIVRTKYSGIKLPVSALRIVNGETGVYTLVNDIKVFKKINVIYKDDRVCIAGDGSELMPYEQVLVNPKEE